MHLLDLYSFVCITFVNLQRKKTRCSSLLVEADKYRSQPATSKSQVATHVPPVSLEPLPVTQPTAVATPVVVPPPAIASSSMHKPKSSNSKLLPVTSVKTRRSTRRHSSPPPPSDFVGPAKNLCSKKPSLQSDSSSNANTILDTLAPPSKDVVQVFMDHLSNHQNRFDFQMQLPFVYLFKTAYHYLLSLLLFHM